MRFTTVFNKLLSLQGVRVHSVDFDFDTIRVGVRPTSRKHRCPHCDYSCWASYDGQERRWRHVALGRWQVQLAYRICRLKCPTHGVVTEAVPWATPQARFTTDFEDLVAWTARTMDKTAVTQLLHISWYTVGHIVERVVQRTLDSKRLDDLYIIGLDEVSYRKGCGAHQNQTRFALQKKARIGAEIGCAIRSSGGSRLALSTACAR